MIVFAGLDRLGDRLHDHLDDRAKAEIYILLICLLISYDRVRVCRITVFVTSWSIFQMEWSEKPFDGSAAILACAGVYDVWVAGYKDSQAPKAFTFAITTNQKDDSPAVPTTHTVQLPGDAAGPDAFHYSNCVAFLQTACNEATDHPGICHGNRLQCSPEHQGDDCIEEACMQEAVSKKLGGKTCIDPYCMDDSADIYGWCRSISVTDLIPLTSSLALIRISAKSRKS